MELIQKSENVMVSELSLDNDSLDQVNKKLLKELNSLNRNGIQDWGLKNFSDVFDHLGKIKDVKYKIRLEDNSKYELFTPYRARSEDERGAVGRVKSTGKY